MSPLKQKLNFFTRILGAVVFLFLSISGVLYAGTFSEPTGAPPTQNASMPINSGSTLQQKLGDFWANKIGSTAGYCIGTSCITAWPTSGSVSAACALKTLVKENQNPAVPGISPVGQGCTLSAAETSAGWILASWDYCTGVRSADCWGPKYCVYTKMSCTGGVTVVPGTLDRGAATTYSQGYYEAMYSGPLP